VKRVLTAIVLIPLVLAAVFFSSDWLFATILGLIALICLHEFLRLASVLGDTPHFLAYAFVVLVFFALAAGPYLPSSASGLVVFFWMAQLIFPLTILTWSLSKNDYRASLRGGGLALLGAYYVTIPLICIDVLREHASLGNYFLILLFVIVWGGDVAAFYIGKLFGKHPLAPRVSPGKTWEGSVASVVFASLLAVTIAGWLAPKLSGSPISRFLGPHTSTGIIISPPLWASLLLGVLVNVSAQIGDLVESMLKRAADVKDSGTLLPGHGGMLDRIDALLFAAPVGMLIFFFAEQFFAAEANLIR
jgi:phosphatidate cytidylyltransferase